MRLITTTTTRIKDTFEMRWDCPACPRTGNLGRSHKRCPGCGHPQGARYFPRPEQRVSIVRPAEGRQRICGHCGDFNDPTHACCQACGAPLDDTKLVPLRPSISEHAGETGASVDRRRGVREGSALATLRRVVEDRQRQREEPSTDSAPNLEVKSTPVAIPAPIVDLDDEVDLRDYGISRGPGWSLEQWAIGIGCLLVATLILLVIFWKRDIVLEVQGHTWTRTIEIQRFVAVHDEEWCSSMPSDAYNVDRRSELHHVDHIPDGQDCRVESGSCSESCSLVDNGNGSGSTVCTQTCSPDREVCTTRYRDEPVYADKCYFIVDRWRHQRDAVKSGSGLKPEPVWPEPEYVSCYVTHLGCERLGNRSQSYRVHFTSTEKDAKAFECEYPQARWAKYALGSHWDARVGVLWERLDCDSLKVAAGASRG